MLWVFNEEHCEDSVDFINRRQVSPKMKTRIKCVNISIVSMWRHPQTKHVQDVIKQKSCSLHSFHFLVETRPYPHCVSFLCQLTCLEHDSQLKEREHEVRLQSVEDAHRHAATELRQMLAQQQRMSAKSGTSYTR